MNKLNRHDYLLHLLSQVEGKNLNHPSARKILDNDWSDYWPVIDCDMCLTGAIVTSDDDGWQNYNDEAAIYDEDVKAGGWVIIDDGYVCPPTR